jgi:hypothetical protein
MPPKEKPMRKVVTWKSETETRGPATIYNDYDNTPTSWPYGTVPAGVEKVEGWITCGAARKLAKNLEAEFMIV